MGKSLKGGHKNDADLEKLLHANFRCGRMYTTRAEYGTERCALPSADRMCVRM